jgi:hypothetical protein
MVMVAHQEIGMDFPASALANLRQGLKKTDPIGIIFKDIFPPVSPAHHNGKWLLPTSTRFFEPSPLSTRIGQKMLKKGPSPLSPLSRLQKC